MTLRLLSSNLFSCMHIINNIIVEIIRITNVCFNSILRNKDTTNMINKLRNIFKISIIIL